MRASVADVSQVLSIALATLSAHSVPLAAEPLDPSEPQYGWREVWGGADATKDVWLLYSGITIAPWSRDIYSDGWRFRIASGYGRYDYDYARSMPVEPNCGRPPYPACSYAPIRFNGTGNYTYTDVLIGYHMRLGELTAKAFAGAAMSTQNMSHPDPMSPVLGTEFGVKGIVELWLNLGNNGWTSLDLSYGTAHDTASVRWRAGWRVVSSISIGPELRFDKNAADAEVLDGMFRAGVFARYQWDGGEVSAASGVANRTFADDVVKDNEIAPYATFNLLYQF